ncbi:uncharacterized protein [Zea mays]|uniref:uncharacterized protein isoform X7 n=1 Tax=Zea mays TaxID=4577 RepID=UPI0016531485|nr:uncharacterized protein LOC103634979 isoform X7 [Zea mays]
MARNINSDYIDFSHLGGFDMGINFDEFEENVKKLMEYLDSAHDKAVEFIEDVHAKFYGPFTDDEVPNNDQSSRYVITESSPTSIEKELVGPNTELSTPPACFITMENSSTGCDTDAHKTQSESFSTKSTGLSSMNHVYPENNLSEGAHIDSNDLCIRIYDSSEEVILWNPVSSVKPQQSHELTTIPQDDHALHALETEVTEQVGLNCSGHSDSSVCSGVSPLENSCANCEEKMVLHSANDPVGVTVHDSTTLTQEYHVSYTLHMEQMIEQAGLHCSGHSDILIHTTDFCNALLLEDSSTNYEMTVCLQPYQATLPGTQANRPEVHMVSTISYSANSPVESTIHGTCTSHDSSTSASSCADDPSMSTDSMVKSVDMDGQKHMKNDKIKKMLLRNLSRKLRWSKAQADTHQTMAPGSQGAEDPGYPLVSPSDDDLEDSWEIL